MTTIVAIRPIATMCVLCALAPVVTVAVIHTVGKDSNPRSCACSASMSPECKEERGREVGHAGASPGPNTIVVGNYCRRVAAAAAASAASAAAT